MADPNLSILAAKGDLERRDATLEQILSSLEQSDYFDIKFWRKDGKYLGPDRLRQSGVELTEPHEVDPVREVLIKLIKAELDGKNG